MFTRASFIVIRISFAITFMQVCNKCIQQFTYGRCRLSSDMQSLQHIGEQELRLGAVTK